MDIALVIFPGTNRERDMKEALEEVSPYRVRTIWHKETELGQPDLIILPGGFSYGDYLRCGAMAAHSPVMREVIAQSRKGTPLLGICNGFQMLLETGLLTGALLRNKSLRFVCKRTFLRVENTSSPYTKTLKQDSVFEVPVAHGEGNYFASADQIKSLEDNNQVAFRYCNDNGEIAPSSNPNGSAGNIAGITNKSQNILGMMPHPENAVLKHQNIEDGRIIVKNMIETLAG